MTSSHPIDVEKLLADQLATASPDCYAGWFLGQDRGGVHTTSATGLRTGGR